MHVSVNSQLRYSLRHKAHKRSECIFLDSHQRVWQGPYWHCKNTLITLYSYSVKPHVFCLTGNYSQWAPDLVQGRCLPPSLPTAEGILSSVSYLLSDRCICLRLTSFALCDTSLCQSVLVGHCGDVLVIGQQFITPMLRLKLIEGMAMLRQ